MQKDCRSNPCLPPAAFVHPCTADERVEQALDFLSRRRRGAMESWAFTPEGVGAVEREDMQVDVSCGARRYVE